MVAPIHIAVFTCAGDRRTMQDASTTNCVPASESTMRSHAVVIACCTWGAVGSAVAGQGLTVDIDRLAWPQWQARLQVGTQPIVPTPLWSGGEAGLRPRSGALFSDYYVALPQFGQSGGLRLTSGV